SVFSIILCNLGHGVTESGHIKIDSLLDHHRYLGVIEALAMLDAINAGDYRILEALPAVRVCSHLAMMAMSLVHDGLQFGQSKCWIDEKFAISAEGISASGEHFDPIRTVMNLFANDLACLLHSVNFLIASCDLDPRHADVV